MPEDNQHQFDELQTQLDKVKQDFQSLNDEFYRNNFSASQDFQKYSRFNSRLKVPHYASNPATCEVGEIIEVSGKLLVCSSANTWSIVGTQS